MAERSAFRRCTAWLALLAIALLAIAPTLSRLAAARAPSADVPAAMCTTRGLAWIAPAQPAAATGGDRAHAQASPASGDPPRAQGGHDRHAPSRHHDRHAGTGSHDDAPPADHHGGGNGHDHGGDHHDHAELCAHCGLAARLLPLVLLLAVLLRHAHRLPAPVHAHRATIPRPDWPAHGARGPPLAA